MTFALTSFNSHRTVQRSGWGSVGSQGADRGSLLTFNLLGILTEKLKLSTGNTSGKRQEVGGGVRCEGETKKIQNVKQKKS